MTYLKSIHIFVNNLFIFPVTITLFHSTENYFYLKILFNDLENLVFKTKFYFIEDMFDYPIFKNSDLIRMKSEITKKFLNFPWKNFLNKQLKKSIENTEFLNT